jgi:hypothetical protein
MVTPEKSASKPMSDAHKKALAKGREEGRAIRDYLEALEASKPRRGRRRTPESVEKRLKVVAELVETADNPLSRLQLVQEQLDLETELAAGEPSTDISTLQADFVKIARAYGERKGISYAAWRAIGVAAPVLKEAGIPRTRS